MIKRKETNKLVVLTLTGNGSLSARAIYTQLEANEPELMRREHVKTFKGFVKVLNSFPEVSHAGTGIQKYALQSLK